MSVTKQDAHDLAVRYHAYCVAIEQGDDNGILVWGSMLLEVQHVTNITLCDPKLVARLMTRARSRQAEAA